MKSHFKKMKFSFKDFFSKCDQILSFLRIWSHLLKKSLMENFIFCAVLVKEEVLHNFHICYKLCIRNTLEKNTVHCIV